MIVSIILIVMILLTATAFFMSHEVGTDETLAPLRETKIYYTITAWSLVGLTLIIFLFSVVVIVPTREVGIELTFAKPTGTLGNGLHVKAPWQHVETMDAAIQTDSHVKDGDLNCVTTRIAHQAVACVDVSIRWRIVEDQAGALFQNYRTFDNVRDSLVTRDLNAAINASMETYDVLSVNNQGQSTAEQLSDVAAAVKEQLSAQIGDQIDVLSVIIPVVHFDTSTQERVNALQAQIAQTRIAEQAEQTAKAQASANRALAASVSSDPNVLVSKCLDLLNEAITKAYALPAGFSCWSGSGAVVVPSASAPIK